MNKSVVNRLKIQLAEEIITLEDGYKYYYPTKRGALSASTLRDIADTLDALNKDWDKQVHEELSKKRKLQSFPSVISDEGYKRLKEALELQRYTYKPGVYDVSIKDFRPSMQPASDGDWVRFCDVEDLVKKAE